MAKVSGGNMSGRVGGGQAYTIDTTAQWTEPLEASDGLAGGFLVQIVGTGLTATLTFQLSGDGTNYVACLATNLATGGTGTTATATGLFRIDSSGGLFRLYATSVGAGSAVVTVCPYVG